MILPKLVGVFLYLYLGWKSMKDDFGSNKTLKFLWTGLLIFLVFGRVGFMVLSGLARTGGGEGLTGKMLLESRGFNVAVGYLFWFLASWVYCWGNKWKEWVVFENVIWGGFWLVGGYLLAENKQVELGVLLIAALAGLAVRKKYRSFGWYRSGKKGFVWWFVNMVFWLGIGAVVKWWIGGIGLISGVGLAILGEVWSKR